jgi:putative ATPase
VHVLQPLADDELAELLERARAATNAPPFTDAARDRLIGYADGDARRLLNVVENVAVVVGQAAQIDEPLLERALGDQLRRYDKSGEQFYDTISALHKAVRGSDPDASLYWLVRMLDGGVDPRYVARRLIRMASEDIGLADPRGLRMALDAAEVYERLGSPEGELALAECVVYLAVAPKSNAVYTAYQQARAHVQKEGTRPVPMHLRNAPTALMKQLDYGKGYRYAHDERDGFAAGASYWPDGMEPPHWYQPVERGLEIRIAEKMRQLAAANANANATTPRAPL